MSRQVGDKYEDMTLKYVDGQRVECMGEFEITSIDIQIKDDGSTATVENSKLIRYLD